METLFLSWKQKHKLWYMIIPCKVKGTNNGKHCEYGMISSNTYLRILVLGMTFWGDMPQVGIAYDDPNGVHCFKAISMSGYDGSIVLEDALLK